MADIRRGFCFRLYPTAEQENLFRQFAGVCRLVYNLALKQRETWWRQYERQTGSRLNDVAQCRELTALRAGADWIAAVPVSIQQQALRDLEKAYKNFFAKVARIKAKTAAHRRDWSHKLSFAVANRFGLVVLEKLPTSRVTRSTKGMVEQPGTNARQNTGTNRAILEQGWHRFETALSYKLEERGGYLLTVDPQHTSQTYTNCGVVEAASQRSHSQFECVSCGHKVNVDHNAALAILHRGQSAGVERGVTPASKREAKGCKTPKTSSADEAQLTQAHMDGPGKHLRPQALAG